MLNLETTDIPPRLGVPKQSVINAKGGEMDIRLLSEKGFLRGKWFLYSKP